MIIDKLYNKGLIHPPKFLVDNVHYLCTMGSVAYGVNTDSSDNDVYGFAMPPKTELFPHLAGEIFGFGTQIQRFEQWHETQIFDGPKEYDFTVYSIVKFFQLCMENNPNMVDALFVPQRCIIHSTKVGVHVRNNRKLFLHKGSFHKFRGYAFAQLSKIKTKKHLQNTERAKDVEKHGYSTKFAYHLVRLCLEAEQILMHHDLVLDNNTQILRSIREGEWSLERLEEWFAEKEKSLEGLYNASSLRHSPDEDAIKRVLLECIEMHYGRVSETLQIEAPAQMLLREMQQVLDKYKA